MRSILAIVILAIVVGFNINWVMDHIFFGPTRNDFLTFRIVNHFSRELTGNDSFILPAHFSVQQKQLFQQFNVMMAVSIFSGLVLAFPYIIWELWKFISPALMPNEKKNSIFYINSIWMLFMAGVLTGYFLILPFAINFGLLFKVSDNIVQLFDLSDYTTLFLQVTMGMGVVFLFPIAVYILTYWNSDSKIPENLQKACHCFNNGCCSDYHTGRCPEYDGSSIAFGNSL